MSTQSVWLGSEQHKYTYFAVVTLSVSCRSVLEMICFVYMPMICYWYENYMQIMLSNTELLIGKKNTCTHGSKLLMSQSAFLFNLNPIAFSAASLLDWMRAQSPSSSQKGTALNVLVPLEVKLGSVSQPGHLWSCTHILRRDCSSESFLGFGISTRDRTVPNSCANVQHILQLYWHISAGSQSPGQAWQENWGLYAVHSLSTMHVSSLSHSVDLSAPGLTHVGTLQGNELITDLEKTSQSHSFLSISQPTRHEWLEKSDIIIWILPVHSLRTQLIETFKKLGHYLVITTWTITVGGQTCNMLSIFLAYVNYMLITLLAYVDHMLTTL